MGGCDVIGCEGDENLPYTCNECGGKFCSVHRLPENHNCQALQRRSSDEKPFATGLQGKDEKKRGLTDRLLGRQKSISDQSRTISSDDYSSRHLILTRLSGFLRKGLYLALILGIIAGAGLWAGGGSIPFMGDVSGPLAPALNGTEANASGVASNQSTSGSGAASTEFAQSNVEQLVHEEINNVRRERGLTPLSFDEDLRKIARYHSEDMATSGYFAHTAPNGETVEDRYQQFGYQCQVRTGGNQYATDGENIAKTYYQATIALDNGSTAYYDSPEALADGVVRQWMNSEGHRKNLLKPYWENEGIGVKIAEEDGETAVYITQNFC